MNGLKIILGLILMAALATLGSARLNSTQTITPAAKEHLRIVASTLVPGTALRRQIERGSRGDGIHHSWMDSMQHQGVKRAVVSVRFKYENSPKNIVVVRTMYFEKYESDCAQIAESARLEQIRGSGLEGQLEDFSMDRVEASRWLVIEAAVNAEVGTGTVELFDDEWIPHAPPLLVPSGENHQPALVKLLDDEMGIRKYLASGKISQEELDQALLMASALYDDSCVIKPLLDAGANPNVQGRKEGNTPLINAASTGAVINVRVLLSAGARVGARDHAGRTALWFAKNKGFSEIVQALEPIAPKY